MTMMEWTDKLAPDEKCRDFSSHNSGQWWPDEFLCQTYSEQKCVPLSAFAFSLELGRPYTPACLLHHKIQQAMAGRNCRDQAGGLLELGDAYLGGIRHGVENQGRGADQDPVVAGVRLGDKQALNFEKK